MDRRNHGRVPNAPDFEIGFMGTGVIGLHSTDQRDWARLKPSIVSKVAEDLLQSDVTEYIRTRAVCKPWRSATQDPSNPLQPCFFPRNWVMDPNGIRHDDEEYRFVNVLTGASIRVKLPWPHQYSYHGSSEGHLVLHHTLTDTPRLLNPLTLEFIDLPFFRSVPMDDFPLDDITAAGIIVDVDEASQQLTVAGVLCATDEETSETGMLCCTNIRGILPDWDLCCHLSNHQAGQGNAAVYKGALAMWGDFYVPTRTGNVLKVFLPQLDNNRPGTCVVARMETGHENLMVGSNPYLVPSLDDNDDGMIMVVHSRTTVGGTVSDSFRFFDVDLDKKLVREMQAGIGDRTVFLPRTTLRRSSFPSPLLQEGVYVHGEESLKALFRTGNNAISTLQLFPVSTGL